MTDTEWWHNLSGADQLRGIANMLADAADAYAHAETQTDGGRYATDEADEAMVQVEHDLRQFWWLIRNSTDPLRSLLRRAMDAGPGADVRLVSSYSEVAAALGAPSKGGQIAHPQVDDDGPSL